MIRIGIISDTHNRLHPRVRDLFKDVDEIWHLGDVCDQTILDELEVFCPRLTTILGNNDGGLELPLTLDLEREGETFHLIHIPPVRSPVKSGWLLHGHTHVPRDEQQGGVRWFNPGSAGLANKGAPLSVAFLTKQGQSPFQAQVMRL
jgi:putative phosphoesterase